MKNGLENTLLLNPLVDESEGLKTLKFGGLKALYKEQSNCIPDPYLGKDPMNDKKTPKYFNYALFSEEPNEFKRCVMWTLASMRDVVIYNYEPEDSLQTDEMDM